MLRRHTHTPRASPPERRRCRRLARTHRCAPWSQTLPLHTSGRHDAARARLAHAPSHPHLKRGARLPEAHTHGHTRVCRYTRARARGVWRGVAWRGAGAGAGGGARGSESQQQQPKARACSACVGRAPPPAWPAAKQGGAGTPRRPQRLCCFWLGWCWLQPRPRGPSVFCAWVAAPCTAHHATPRSHSHAFVTPHVSHTHTRRQGHGAAHAGLGQSQGHLAAAGTAAAGGRCGACVDGGACVWALVLPGCHLCVSLARAC
jgi:hypothetical protein